MTMTIYKSNNRVMFITKKQMKIRKIKNKTVNYLLVMNLMVKMIVKKLMNNLKIDLILTILKQKLKSMKKVITHYREVQNKI